MIRPVPDEVILGLLQHAPAHGYDLLESFNSRDQLGLMWSLSTSQLYAVLKRLKSEGAIEGERINSTDGPSKIVYSITAKGREQLEKWLFDPVPSASIHRIRVLFLSRLYIADLLGMDRTKIIRHQRKVCENQLKKFYEEREKASSPFEQLTIDFVIGQLESALAWLDLSKMKFSK
jgi:DNA-binding PadR family transcriptional regulator